MTQEPDPDHGGGGYGGYGQAGEAWDAGYGQARDGGKEQG